MQAIADRAGVSTGTIHAIVTGKRAGVRQAIARKILSVKTAPRNEVPAWRVQRRLHALIAVGYGVYEIADRAGVSASGLYTVLRGECEKSDRRLAAAIFGLYADLQHQPARRVVPGYAPPLAWDNIDDPDERPQGVIEVAA